MAQSQKYMGIISITIFLSFCNRNVHIKPKIQNCGKPYGIMIVNSNNRNNQTPYNNPFTLLIGNVICSDTSPWIVKCANKGYSNDSLLDKRTKGYFWLNTECLLFPFKFRNSYTRDTGNIKLIEFSGYGDDILLNSSLIKLVIQHKDSVYHIDCDIYKQAR